MSVRTRTPLRRLALWTVMAFALALGAPGIAPAHEVATAQGHAEQDGVLLKDAATERRLADATVARSRSDARAAAAAVVGNEGDVGQWEPLVPWPVVAIHDALLPDGKVVAWDASNNNVQCDASPPYSCSYTKTTDHTFTRATVFDPATGTQTAAWVSGHNIFCAGLAHLTDGRLFTAGGNADIYSNGIVNTYTFNVATGSWTLGNDMTFPRWYPSVTPLTNGEMLITGGRPWIPEVRRTDGSIRQLSSQTGTMDVPYYPWMDVGPDGRVFYSGPDDKLRKLDPAGPGAWQDFGTRGDGENRDYGSHALYDVGKILVAGGGPSSKTARTIDINGTTPQVSTTSPMAFGRRQFNLTTLADGTVLATGGNSTGAQYIDMNGGVYQAELWNPTTGQWKTLAAEQVTRQYHSTALLLADGRVLSAGGGVCDACDTVGYLGKNAQIFTPPYLFKKDGSGELAPRPEISAAPSALPYAADFQITTPDAASIRKAALLRLGAVTHSTNMEQRYVPLSFSAGSGELTATSPQNANIAPPGVYMLFISDDAGVPSVAKMIQIGSESPPPPPPPPPPPNNPPSIKLDQPANSATFTAPATVHLAATANDTNGHVWVVQFYSNGMKIGEDQTASDGFAFDWSGVGAGTYALTAKATDNDDASTTSSPSTITVTAAPSPNQPPTVTLAQPPNGAKFTAPATVNLAATASDTGGSVTKVEFFRGGTKLGQDTTSPYTFSWSGVASGTYTLTAKATDNGGATTTSAASTITVNAPPTASITYPPNGAVFPRRPTITITANATDSDGSVTSVEFRDGSTVLGRDTSAPYSHSWTNVASGSHTLRVRATDNAGAVTTSAAVGISVR
jgi:hypothetical protein